MELVVWRPEKGPLLVTAPDDSAEWLRRQFPSREPVEGSQFHLARTSFRPVITAAMRDLDHLIAIEDRHGSRRACDVRCQEAMGDECRCICLGSRHGGGWRGDLVLVGQHALIDNGPVRTMYEWVRPGATVDRVWTSERVRP